jgi:antitoxin (DNA-binding transcriptional repressor) of toxin-antitoxin stability system
VYIFGIEEAAEKLEWLIELVQQGHVVDIYRDGKPCARLVTF